MFAFRLHQFLSKGDNVYVTLEPPATRHVTEHLSGRRAGAAARDRSGSWCRPRSAGSAARTTWSVTRSDADGGRRYAARRDNDASGGDEASGYLFISDDQPWPSSLEQVLVEGRLPYSWLTYRPGRPGRSSIRPG